MSSNWRQDKTQQVTTFSGGAASGQELVPGLTLLSHPDPERVGERLTLPILAVGQEVSLSRLAPVFKAPGRHRATSRPLEDTSVSRQPILLQSGADTVSVTLDCASTQTRVSADGEDITERRTFCAAEIDRGVVLLVGKIVLLLHRLPVRPCEEVAKGRLAGESRAMVQIRQEIRRLAEVEVPVLLRGATGTGKELVARALHAAGPRRAQPFLAVNMAAVPPSLAAAELFGARRGAFTGADRRQIGFFQHADGGTLFLDEIGETPSEVQPMLLRVLENKEILPLGGVAPVRVDVRVIAATDLCLEEGITSGTFRAPLLHRLAGYTLHLPSLTERRDDIGRLFHLFLWEELEKIGQGRPGEPARPWPPPAVMARLARYDWPGNVRELRNVARWMAIAGRELPAYEVATRLEEFLVAKVGEQHFDGSPAPGSAPAPKATPAGRRRKKLRKAAEVGEEELFEALRKHRFELKGAALELGVSRTNLYRLVRKHPHIRQAKELGMAEIEAALARHGGDPQAAAAELEVSARSLKRRLTELERLATRPDSVEG